MFNFFKKIVWCIECEDAKGINGRFCSHSCWMKYHKKQLPPVPTCPIPPEGIDASAFGPLPRCGHGIFACPYCKIG